MKQTSTLTQRLTNVQTSFTHPTAKEQHLMDVYDALGVHWGEDVFAEITWLRRQAYAVNLDPSRRVAAGQEAALTPPPGDTDHAR